MNITQPSGLGLLGALIVGLAACAPDSSLSEKRGSSQGRAVATDTLQSQSSAGKERSKAGNAKARGGKKQGQESASSGDAGQRDDEAPGPKDAAGAGGESSADGSAEDQDDGAAAVDIFKEENKPAADESPAEEKPAGDASTGTDTAGETPPPPPAATNFAKWCKSAGEVKMMTAAPGLKAVRAEFCDGDTPTELLTKTLIANAYAGVGSINFTVLRALASDRRTDTTGMRFAYGIKMPTSAKDYFDRVAPKALTPEGLKATVEGPGGTATVEVLQSFSNDGAHEVRGVLAHQTLEKQVRGRRVIVESENRTDQYMIEDGSLYMFTTAVMRAISSTRSTETISALVKVGEDAYFLTVVDVVVNNRGFPGIAEPELARSSQAGSLALYQRIVKNSMP